MPKVVIGIPCFNEDQYITDTLLSAIQQLDEYTDLEIWISDNKSTDNSVSKVEGGLRSRQICREPRNPGRAGGNVGPR
jgi:glycosyltransferase involved in cell wall biosynthesis